jgi:uncharacterized membrane protein YeaQ/YmgE (transglycosylase-associated protein family)
MEFSAPQVVTWIIVGLAGGTLAGMLVRFERKGFGFFNNIALGLAGALIGGVLFRLFELLPNLDKISVSMRDVVSAAAGSLLVLLFLWFRQRNRPVS